MMLIICMDGKCQNIFCLVDLAQNKIDGLDVNTV